MELLFLNLEEPLSIRNLYLVCMYVGLAYTAFVFFFGDQMGSGHDVDAGHTVDVSSGGDIAVSPFHPLVIAAFITSFGATGILMNHYGGGVLAGLLVASTAATLVSAVFFFGVVKTLFAAQGNSLFEMEQAVGMAGQVTITIPAEGTGEVAFVAKRRRFTVAAQSASRRPIRQGEAVKIVQRVGNIFYVEKQ